MLQTLKSKIISFTIVLIILSFVAVGSVRTKSHSSNILVVSDNNNRIRTVGTPVVLSKDSIAKPRPVSDAPVVAIPSLPKSGSLLDQTGIITIPLKESNVRRWRSNGATLQEKLWLAEWTLAKIHDPINATKQFESLIAKTQDLDPIRGLSERGIGFSLMFQGRYKEAREQVESLMKSNVAGVDRQVLGSMERHLAACAAYHRNHELLGITQPGKFDPLAGVRSIEKSLEILGDKKAAKLAKKRVPHDGFGPTMKSVITGLSNLGYGAQVTEVKPENTYKMPMPQIVYVEHDHFVTVLSAAADRVTYWCVDCGGSQVVTVKQWRAMEPSWAVFPVKKGVAAEVDGVYASTTPIYSFTASQQNLGPQPLNNWDTAPGGSPQGFTCCPDCLAKQPCPKVNAGGNATNDPVNLATAAEEYEAGTDISVYNPKGPSVSIERSYNGIGRSLENGFGNNWTFNYNWCMNVWNNVNDQTTVDIVVPNSTHFGFTLPSGAQKPDETHTTPVVMVPSIGGLAVRVTWRWDPTYYRDFFQLEFEDGTRMVTRGSEVTPAGNNYLKAGTIYRIDKIYDKTLHWISFHYGDFTRNINISDGQGGVTSSSIPLRNLIAIKDQDGTDLLTLSCDSNGSYAHADDRYGRRVIFQVLPFESQNLAAGFVNTLYGITKASQLCSNTATSAPSAYEYGYALMHFGSATEQIHGLRHIKVPSPTGQQQGGNPVMSVATIGTNWAGRVISTTDANGNVATYDYTNLIINGGVVPATCGVVRKDPNGNIIEKIYVSFNEIGNLTKVYNADAQVVYEATYGTLPYRPSQVTDGLNHHWDYTYTNFGQVFTVINPRNVLSRIDYDYSIIPTGLPITYTEHTQQNQYKTTTTLEYTPYGQLWKVNSPIPGQANQNNRQTTTITYTGLGNVASVTSPGKNSSTFHTTTFNYTQDGTFNTTEKLGQPVLVTNSNSEQTHIRYNDRGTTQSVKDHLGNETTLTYNLADQALTSVLPATGNTGTGHAYTQTDYLYVGGPAISSKAYDESGVLTRQVNTTYGPEMEVLSVDGSTEKTSYEYTATYRLKKLIDGNSHATEYTYDQSGQCIATKYPLNTGSWFDQYHYTYDHGFLTSRTDGRNITTTYDYTEPDSQLHSITYSNGNSITPEYDGFGRVLSVTDSTGVSSINSYDAWTMF